MGCLVVKWPASRIWLKALDWGWAQGRPALLRVRTDRGRDAALRVALRRAVQAGDHNGSATGCLP
jgi:hypothetical protein